ncbi:MAG TPA: MtrB/PioB family outer membrane beta-barrel protein [Terriglobales bacterium]
MKKASRKTGLLLLVLVLAQAGLWAQEAAPPLRGMVEAGTRWSGGDVYGRPDLPFSPELKTSKYEEYRDLRNGFFVRRFRLTMNDLMQSKYYLDLQSDRAIYRDQSYLGTFGAWNSFKLQFRYDEIPHTYSNTTRTLYTQTSRGVLTIPLLTRSALQNLAATAATTVPGTIETQLEPSMSFIVPAIERRKGTFSFSSELAPGWGFTAMLSREHETGTRPIGLIFNSSPSASLTGGYGAEVPEPIDYFINDVSVSTERSWERWVVRFGYSGSFFQNHTSTLSFDNPFRTTDCVAPTGCTTATQGPATGRVDLYPDNKAHYLNFAGSFALPFRLRLLASITGGWLRQNDPFLPYTSNSLLEAQTSALPATSLHGQKHTLAMNYKLIEPVGKKFEFKAAYRQYDYNNDTPVLSLTPVEGDLGAPTSADNIPFGYNRKNVEVTGNWYFAKKSSAKFGYEGEIMDRSHRDVEHSTENGFVAAVDSALRKQLSFRASYRYSSRNPEVYEDEEALATAGGITNDSIFSRRFDEATRTRNRGDVELEFDPTERLSFTGFGGTLQDNYNHRGGVNSTTALNFVPGNADPYYLYGVLKDLSYNAGFDGDFTLNSWASVFAEYSYERYYKSMVSRYRVPGGATPTPLDCSISGRGCDSANNDWGSNARDYVHIYTIGWDLHPGKKTYINTYYSLSAAKGHVDSHPFGDDTITTGPDKFLLTGTNAAVDYPETVSRTHEVVTTVRYKLTSRLTPKLEYRYQQFDNRDYQTSAMTPYMGCVSPLPPGAAVPGCPAVLLGTPSPFYPFFVVGDTNAARFLFLGADQPSYHAHYLAATLEYHF